MNALITIKCYNRPIYLYQVLKELCQDDNFHDYDLLISGDLTDASMQEQILTAVKLLDINCKLIFHNFRLGCSMNTEYCLSETFNNGYDYAIHLEDDTLVSEKTLEYFDAVYPILDKNNYFAACTFHRPCHETVVPERSNKLVAKKIFDPSGGFSMTKKTWERIQEMGGMFAVDYVSQKGRTHDCQGKEWLNEIHKCDFGGFGYPFDHFFREGKYCIFPKVSVVKNIGRIGQHLTNPAQHTKLQYNDNWIETIGIPWPPMEYDIENIEIDDRKFVEDGIENAI